MRIRYNFEGRNRKLEDFQQYPPSIGIQVEVDGQPKHVELEIVFAGGNARTDDSGWCKGVAVFDVTGISLWDMWETG